MKDILSVICSVVPATLQPGDPVPPAYLAIIYSEILWLALHSLFNAYRVILPAVDARSLHLGGQRRVFHQYYFSLVLVKLYLSHD